MCAQAMKYGRSEDQPSITAIATLLYYHDPFAWKSFAATPASTSSPSLPVAADRSMMPSKQAVRTLKNIFGHICTRGGNKGTSRQKLDNSIQEACARQHTEKTAKRKNLGGSPGYIHMRRAFILRALSYGQFVQTRLGAYR